MDFNFQEILDNMSISEIKRFRDALSREYDRRLEQEQQYINARQEALNQVRHDR